MVTLGLFRSDVHDRIAGALWMRLIYREHDADGRDIARLPPMTLEREAKRAGFISSFRRLCRTRISTVMEVNNDRLLG